MLAFVVHGIAPLAITLLILVIFVLGVVSLLKLAGRGISKARDQLTD